MTDQPTLRDRIAQALEEADYRLDMRRGDLADAVMAVLPAPVDRAACDCEAEVHMGVGFYHHPWCATKRGTAPADDIDWKAKYELEHARLVEVVAALVGGRSAGLREAADECDRRATAVDALSSSDFGEEARAARELAAAATEFRRMADEAQQPEEAWPSESQWRVEIYEPGDGYGYWLPAGTLTTKAEAERRLTRSADGAGTDVRRRIVRTTTTYTVEPEGTGR
ncbi:hypothetical protein K1Y80_02300 [Streptomyces sp. MAG02]|nr:hypothetical protein [Streptomyces sp. MAG02]